MAIEAPLSSYKKKNMLIMMAILFGMGIWCIYDGYFNQNFIQEHLNENGNAQGWLAFNKKAPPFLLAGGVIYGVIFFMTKDKKIVADDTALNTGKEAVAYETIEKINKTYFDSKGYFIITYTDSSGQSKDIKLSDRTFDNLPAVLDYLVAKIS
ncbi:MAG: hypothetical protein ISS71_03305 [Phycisphaerae bacterium]|nr:hypothetical protein [Phycisphaerae bacterium]